MNSYHLYIDRAETRHSTLEMAQAYAEQALGTLTWHFSKGYFVGLAEGVERAAIFMMA